MDRKRQEAGGTLPCLLFLGLFFLGGVLMGQVLAGRVPDAAGDELGRYLSDYLRLDGQGERAAGTALSAAVLYFRYPVLAFLLGFTALGIALVPCLTAAYGFFLSFSVCCFTASFGADGVLLALAVFGLRCVVTLPCYLLVAAPAWISSATLTSLSLGGGRRALPVVYGRSYWIRLGGVAAALLAGMCVDLFLSPWFLQMTLERIFY